MQVGCALYNIKIPNWNVSLLTLWNIFLLLVFFFSQSDGVLKEAT